MSLKKKVGGWVDKSNATEERDNKLKPIHEGTSYFKSVYCRDRACKIYSKNICRKCEYFSSHYK